MGVFKEREGLPLLANQLGYLINNDKEEHNNLSILTSFCKHCGDDYAGLMPRKYRYIVKVQNFQTPKVIVEITIKNSNKDVSPEKFVQKVQMEWQKVKTFIRLVQGRSPICVCTVC